jgi:diguanylate cyclase (GGDEF)-like protein
MMPVIPDRGDPVPMRPATPLEILPARAVVRAMSRVLLAAAALVCLWAGLDGASGDALIAALVFAAAAGSLGVALRLRAPEHPAAVVQRSLVAGGLLLTAAAIVAGPGRSPFILFSFWLAPYAFLVWRPALAAGFVALLSLGATTLLGWHPGHVSPGWQDVPDWLIAVGGPLIVGWVVACLTERLVERQALAERMAAWQNMVSSLARRAISELYVADSVARAAAVMLQHSLSADGVQVTVRGGDGTVEAGAGSTPAEAEETTRFTIGYGSSAFGSIKVTRGQALDAEESALTRNVADVLAVAAHRSRQEQEARARVGADVVTGLPGREHFVKLLGAELGARHAGIGGTLLLLGLNGFGLVNDTLGPAAGDQLLAAVGKRFRGAVGERVTVARIGGDEFAVFDPDIEHDGPAVALAQRLQRVLRDPFDLDGVGHHVTVSIGVLVLPAGGSTDPQAALRDAHVAQRHAAASGRGRFELFDARMREGLEQRRALEQDLRLAIKRQEFRLVYQPIVDLQTRRVVGAETLLRWQRPGHGLVAPGAFMDVAEGSDLIVPIGAWVLREALRQLRAWEQTVVPALNGFKLSVNLSGRQLADPRFPELVARTVRAYDVDPTRLTFELTETALVDEDCGVESAVEEIKRLGVGLALDDFGTGYASLSYVRRFPFDTLKLDRSFALGRSPEDVALIRAAISMGHALGMQVVGEGVETEEHAAELAELGCGLGQGYFFGRPMTAGGLRAGLWQPGVRATS